MAIQWEWKFGPATIGVVVQTVAILGMGWLAFESVKNVVESSKQQVIELKMVVKEMQNAAQIEGNRITRVEAVVEGVNKSLDRIETKIDSASAKK